MGQPEKKLEQARQWLSNTKTNNTSMDKLDTPRISTSLINPRNTRRGLEQNSTILRRSEKKETIIQEDRESGGEAEDGGEVGTIA